MVVTVRASSNSAGTKTKAEIEKEPNIVVEDRKSGVPSKVTLSFGISKVETVALLKQLIRRLDPGLINMGMIDPKIVKSTRPSKVRIYTDE
jgi:hypothetical protein